MDKIIEKYPELNILVEYTPASHSVDFRAFEIVYEMDGKDYFELKGSGTGASDAVDDMDKAERLVEGVVKWDGCSHLTFGDHEGYLHLCGKHNIESLSEIIKKIYFRCGSFMPSTLKGEFENDTNQ